MWNYVAFIVILLAKVVELSHQCHRASGQFSNCDFEQFMETGVPYYVYTPNYPMEYEAGSACRWVAATSQSNRIDIYCEIDIPYSQNCIEDRLSISLSGDPNMRDAKNYCGKRTITLSSWDNFMKIVLLTSTNSRRGTFLCKIIASPQPCNCGWQKTDRIVGGTEAKPNEFPMMAALSDVTYANNPQVFCGATIISKRSAITAAHCAIHRNTDNTALLVGEHDIRYKTPASQTLSIEYFLQHELFNPRTFQNDIAIVRTVQNILYSGLVGPVCLPFKYQNSDFTGLLVEAMGWGNIDYGGPSSPVLRKTELVVQSNITCYTFYPKRISNKQFCTYGDRTDTCQNDSGGPLLWYDISSERINILGLVSYGKSGCGTDNPAVNTNVAKYISWIIAKTPQETYCVK